MSQIQVLDFQQGAGKAVRQEAGKAVSNKSLEFVVWGIEGLVDVKGHK